MVIWYVSEDVNADVHTSLKHLKTADRMVDKARAMRAQAEVWEAQQREGCPPPFSGHPLLRPGDIAWAFLKGHTPWPCVICTREAAERLGVQVGPRVGNKVRGMKGLHFTVVR